LSVSRNNIFKHPAPQSTTRIDNIKNNPFGQRPRPVARVQLVAGKVIWHEKVFLTLPLAKPRQKAEAGFKS